MKKPWNLKISPYKSGYLAEAICRLYMRLHGYRIVEKNVRCGSGKNTICGEIDFIVTKEKRLIFCEVKQRQHTADFIYALSFNQQQRILRGGSYFIKTHRKYHDYSIQFDVFFVRLPFHIERIENALSEQR